MTGISCFLFQFPDFTAKYPNFMDLRSIILKAQVGGYSHIFEIVHDLKLIIYHAKIYLKVSTYFGLLSWHPWKPVEPNSDLLNFQFPFCTQLGVMRCILIQVCPYHSSEFLSWRLTCGTSKVHRPIYCLVQMFSWLLRTLRATWKELPAQQDPRLNLRFSAIGRRG